MLTIFLVCLHFVGFGLHKDCKLAMKPSGRQVLKDYHVHKRHDPSLRFICKALINTN